jgi:hypothetical protein
MKKSNREQIQTAIAMNLHFAAQRNNLQNALEAKVAPMRALYEEARRNAEQEFAADLRQCEEKISSSAAVVQRILNQENRDLIICAQGRARLVQDFLRHIEPAEFLRVAPGGTECLSVLIGKAEKYLSAAELSALVKEIPKGKPKLVIET